MGGQAERKQYNIFQTSAPRGSLNFNGGFTANPARSSGTGYGLADLLLGLPANGNIQLLDGTRGFRRTETGFFLQDDWKVNSHFTLNLGVRYEKFLGYPWTEVGNRQENFLLASGALVPVGTNGIPRSGAQGDNNNVSPRIGFAYAFTPKTIVRSGYAVFYAAPQYEITRNLGLNPPFAGTWAFTNNTLSVATARTIDQGFNRTVQQQNAALNALDPNLRTPYVQQWNLNVQRQLPGNMVLTVAYVGTKGTKLRDQYNVNQPVPGAAAVASRRPYPFFNDIQYTANVANSSYHALQATLDKRLSHGLNFLASYTYSHAIDTTTTFGGSHQNSLNLAADRGNADWDLRHNFSLSLNYALPSPSRNGFLFYLAGGWQVNGILRVSTGLPFSVSPATNTLNGSGSQRADVVPGCPATLSNPTPTRWFNTACFATPGLYQYGNSGRNILFGPGTHQLDASLFRRFPLGTREGAPYFELRGEVFNISNTPQFNNPNSTVGSVGQGNISSAGSPPSFQRTSRQIQLGAKFYF
jgi:outer membrane receptor protein involved in Fe transport